MPASAAIRKKVVVILGLLIFVFATYRFSATNYTDLKPSTAIVQQTPSTMLQAILHDNTSSQVKPASKIIIHSNVRRHQDPHQLTDTHATPALPKVDHFIDWPSAFEKSGCKLDYSLRDRSFSLILFMKDVIDSLPIQTVLSVLQFSSQTKNPIRDIIVTFVNESASIAGHQAYIEEIQRLAGSNLTVSTTSAGSEWRAKLNAIRLASSEQVLVADDTVIMNRYFAPSLLYTLQENPNSIITPHKDLFMSMRIYTMYADKKMHPDSQIWQETTFGIYHVANDMKMKLIERPNVHKLPTTMPTAGLTGEVFVGTRSHLSFLLSQMKTDEVAELSLLSYMCGSGIIGNKCSVAVRANGYWMTAPKTKDPENLQRLYPFFDTNPNNKAGSCKDVKHYFEEIHRFLSNI